MRKRIWTAVKKSLWEYDEKSHEINADLQLSVLGHTIFLLYSNDLSRNILNSYAYENLAFVVQCKNLYNQSLANDLTSDLSQTAQTRRGQAISFNNSENNLIMFLHLADVKSFCSDEGRFHSQ